MKKLLSTIGVLLLITSISFSQTKIEKETQLQTSVLSKKETPKKTQEEFLNEKKDEYIKYTSKEFREDNNIPSSFPKYVNTGNVLDDTSLFEARLKQWVKENEEEYKRIEPALR